MKNDAQNIVKAKKPRLHMLYALAPESVKAAEANQIINQLVASDQTPLCIYHDHFLGRPGGIAFFDIQALEEVDDLESFSRSQLKGWHYDLRPLIFSYNPAALDEQIAYTLKSYGNVDWNELKQENRPSYAKPNEETLTASDE